MISNGEAVTFDPRVNDTDADGDTPQVLGFTQGTVGTVALSGGNISYTPGSQFLGHDSFSYTISDGSASAASTVVVQSTAPVTAVGPVTGSQVPDQPRGFADRRTANERCFLRHRARATGIQHGRF